MSNSTVDCGASPLPDGIHENIDRKAYHADPRMSISSLKGWATGKGMSMSERALLSANLLHAMVEAAHDDDKSAVRDHYVRMDQDVDLRTKDGKAVLAEWQAAHPGKDICRPNEWDHALAMWKGLKACPDAWKIITAPGRNELAVCATLEDVACRGLIDMSRRACIADLKTTRHPDQQAFADSIVDFGYAEQAAFYVDLWAEATGVYLPFVWVVVSKLEPFNAWVRIAKPSEIAFGRRAYRMMLNLYKRYGGNDVSRIEGNDDGGE